MPDSFLFYIFEKQLKTAIVYVPTGRTFHVSKNIKLFLGMFWQFFFFIIMRIYITTKKYTVNKIRRMKNTQKHTNI